MAGLQDWIHSIEEGAGARRLKLLLILAVVVGLAVIYDLRLYKNFSNQESMDMAQLGRNIAEGKGFTTQWVRPFSLYLMQKRVNDQVDDMVKILPASRETWTSEQRQRMDQLIARTQLKDSHPDLSNPPVYPLLLAGFMKILPFDFDSVRSAKFVRYQPEILIVVLNQLLFFLAIFMVFRLARRLFDLQVAWMTSGLMLGTELFWRFSASGLSTMLLLVIFLGVVWCLVLMEYGVEEGLWGSGRLVLLAGLTGLLMGLGGLTRYAFALMIIPTLIFMGSFLGTRRTTLVLVCGVVFSTMMIPWMARNYELSGAPFGTATYAVYEGTPSFPATRMERSLEPDFSRVVTGDIREKLVTNVREMLVNDFPKLGGNWISAFFLVGLLVPFKSKALSRLRYFLLMSLAVLVLAQALGRTHVTVGSPDVNSENLLALLVPLVIVFGCGLFFILLDQVRIAVPGARSIMIGGFVIVLCGPLLCSLFFAPVYPMAYPPYFPPKIRETADWMKDNEWMMSDVPAAVAWYGHKQCVSLSWNSESEFRSLSQLKPVLGLYLTPRTLDAKFLTDWIRGDYEGWGAFILEVLLKRETPTGFPLHKAPNGFFPDQLFLSDRVRWDK